LPLERIITNCGPFGTRQFARLSSLFVPDPRLIVGTMSGTSADGVDAAVVRITGRGLDMNAQLVLHHHRPYDDALKKEIFAFRADDVRSDVLGRLARMGRQITLTCATTVNEALLAANIP